MFLVTCNEAFGYTHEQILGSSMALILAMLREHGYLVNERNKSLYPDDDTTDTGTGAGEWVELVDFNTGKKKKVRKIKPD